MMHPKRVRWTASEAKTLLKQMIEFEGISSIVCPREHADPSALQRRRKQGFFKSLGKAVATKTPDQCKAKLQKFQEKFKGRVDMLSLDLDVFVDTVLGQQKSLDEKDDPPYSDVISKFNNSNYRKKRLRKQPVLHISHAMPSSVHKQSIGLADTSPHPSTAVSKPFNESRALRHNSFIDFADGLIFEDDGEAVDFLNTDFTSNNEAKQGVKPQKSMTQTQAQIMRKWAQVYAEIVKVLETLPSHEVAFDAQTSLHSINDQISKMIQALGAEPSVSNDTFDMVSIDLSVFYPN